jgi:hypothetical protein
MLVLLASRLVVALAGVVASVPVVGGGLIVSGKMILVGIIGHVVVSSTTNCKDDVLGLSPRGSSSFVAAVTMST